MATEDRNIPGRCRSSSAERAKATVVTVDASHAVAVSPPCDVARLVDEAVRATA
ncbi:hypothetical protein [Streptomyces sp. KL116D]|uniref:hypothetical protein n=1 Tax=Streptomyces sp. KL116D TaxID=3045152 RepID=UPI0035585E89